MKKVMLSLCGAAAVLAAGFADSKDTSSKDTSSTGGMGMVACSRGENCTLYCCKDGMCRNGTCKAE